MSYNDNIFVIEAMERYGGSFVKSLANAFKHADGNNFTKLKAAFPEYWEEYTKMADRDAAKHERDLG